MLIVGLILIQIFTLCSSRKYRSDDYTDDQIKDLELTTLLIKLDKSNEIWVGSRHPILHNTDDDTLREIIQYRLQYLVSNPQQFIKDSASKIVDFLFHYDDDLYERCKKYAATQSTTKSRFQLREEEIINIIKQEVEKPENINVETGNVIIDAMYPQGLVHYINTNNNFK